MPPTLTQVDPVDDGAPDAAQDRLSYATAAQTFGRVAGGAFDQLGTGLQDAARSPLAWTLTGLLLAASGLLVSFRKGWLVLPWRIGNSP